MTETRQITDTEFRIDTLIRREADPQDETTESGIMRAAQTIAAEIDALTAERDAARAQVIEARAMASEREDFRLKQIADIRQERDAYREGYNRLTAQLAEARAEVERLRPAAEAWEAREGLIATSSAWRDASPDDEIRTYQAMQTADEKLAQAAARARAAKESL